MTEKKGDKFKPQNKYYPDYVLSAEHNSYYWNLNLPMDVISPHGPIGEIAMTRKEFPGMKNLMDQWIQKGGDTKYREEPKYFCDVFYGKPIPGGYRLREPILEDKPTLWLRLKAGIIISRCYEADFWDREYIDTMWKFDHFDQLIQNNLADIIKWLNFRWVRSLFICYYYHGNPTQQKQAAIIETMDLMRSIVNDAHIQEKLDIGFDQHRNWSNRMNDTYCDEQTDDMFFMLIKDMLLDPTSKNKHDNGGIPQQMFQDLPIGRSYKTWFDHYLGKKFEDQWWKKEKKDES